MRFAASALITLLVASPAFAAAPRFLIDSIHAHNYLSPPAEHNYHAAYGYRRAMAELRRHGVGISEVREGRLDAARLAEADVLFLNLVSADRPPFFLGEIEAITNFVKNGGGLLLITDHTNCYYHANRLAPLLERLGIEVFHETACEPSIDSLSQSGVGWIRVSRFSDHPVNRDLRHIAMQAAGALGPVDAIVARTGPASWGDAEIIPPFGENAAPGFYGNWKQDPAERTGPLGVVVAKEFGKGRIVAVADQNIFADPFLFYADNARLWSNSVSWLAKIDLKSTENIPGPHILCYEDHAKPAFGDSFGTGFYNAFALIGGLHHATANDRIVDARYDLLVFAHNNYTLSDAQLDALAAHLKRGKHLLLLLPDMASDKPRGLTAALAARLGRPETVLAKKSTESTYPNIPGKLITYVDRDGARNGPIPPPEKPLTGLSVDALAAIVKRAASPD